LKRAKLGYNKLLPAQVTTWKYARVMQFLEPHMKYRITENIDSDNCEEDTDKSEQDSTSEYKEAKCSNPQKRRCVEPPIEAPTIIQQDGDALDSFFCCILKSTREMPQWMQTQVKKKIFAVIIEAEERLSSEDNSTATNAYDLAPVKTENFTEDSCDYI
jgi:hypothetical protein